MTNTSRFLGSDEAFALQQDAASSIYKSASEANAKVSEGAQSYLSGLTRNSEANIQLATALANTQSQVRETSFQQLAAAGLQVADQLGKQKAQAKAAKTEAERKIDTERRFAAAQQAVNEVTGRYEADNWSQGEWNYTKEIYEAIGSFYPEDKIDPDNAANLTRLTQAAAEAKLGHSKRTGEKLRTAVDSQQRSMAARYKEQLRLDLVGQFKAISHSSLDDDVRQRVDFVVTKLNEFRGSDLGLPTDVKVQIEAEILQELNEAYGANLEQWTKYTAKINDGRKYAQQRSIIETSLATGKIALGDYRLQVSELDNRYPGQSDLAVKLGDAEKLKLELGTVNEGIRKLAADNADRAIVNLAVDPETQKSLAAYAYFDDNFLADIESNPAYANNPGIRRIAALAKRRREYDNSEAKKDIQNAGSYAELARLNLSNSKLFFDQASEVIRLKDAGQPPANQQQVIIGTLLDRIDPGLGDGIRAAMSQPNKKVDFSALNQELQRYSGQFNQVRDQLLSEVRARERQAKVEFQDLDRLGLLVPEADLQRLAVNGKPLLESLNKRVQEERQRAVQQVQSPSYGVQPNFNPSSTYAPAVDDKGKLVLAPRAAARTLTIGGQTVTLPLIAGRQGVKTSPYGMRIHPVTGDRKFHAGVDLGANLGDRAVALVSGTVAYVGKAKGYGNFVDIIGDNGFLYRYAHHRGNVALGSRVTPGQVVATSDASGIGTGAHLHFEVRKPQYNANGQYEVGKNYGQANSHDPIEHLKQLSAGSSNILQPRGDTTAFRANPSQKTSSNSTLLSNGWALNGSTAQAVNGQPMPIAQVYNFQRPAAMGKVLGKVRVGSVNYDFGDDLGYSELTKDSNLKRAFHDTAQRLGIPTHWLVDIARQESGSLNPYVDHSNPVSNPNGNYGLFGFGSDSFSDKSIHKRLRAGKIDGVGQLALYERYLRENGWDKVKKQKGGNLSIADVWAFSKMGWNMRQRFWATGDTSVRSYPGTKLTYADELKLLGKWVGRSYNMSGADDRRSRNAPIDDSLHASCPICQQMAASQAYAVHRHIG